MRLVFAGTPAVAVPSLLALNSAGHELAAVVTRPDAPVGRKRVLTPSPVAVAAEDAALPVLRAARADEALTSEIAALTPDLGVVVAYGALLRPPLLAVPRLGWINLHFSLLPRWRGAAPVQHAILAGDTVTGACVFQLEAGLDTGPVFARIEAAIAPTQTAGGLLDELAHSGAELLKNVVADLALGSARSEPQVGEVTFAPKLSALDGAVDPGRPAAEVSARIRGVTPEPGAFVAVDGARVKLLEVAGIRDSRVDPGAIELREGRVLLGAADGAVELVTVQPAGKTAMSAVDWWRGRGRVLHVETPR